MAYSVLLTLKTVLGIYFNYLVLTVGIKRILLDATVAAGDSTERCLGQSHRRRTGRIREIAANRSINLLFFGKLKRP